MTQHDATIDPLLKKIEAFMGETPKISQAAQTFLAHELASASVSQNGLFGLKSYTTDAPEHGMRAMRLILEAVNSVEMLPPHEWGLANPQGEEQKGMDRMEQIAEYKVAHTVWRRIKETNGGKVTKSLGISFLRLVWPDVQRLALAKCASANTSSFTLLVTAGLERLGTSLGGQFMRAKTGGGLVDEGLQAYHELIWAKNVDDVLNKRREKRLEEVRARLDEQDRIQRELVEMVRGGNEVGGEARGLTIEEVAVEEEEEEEEEDNASGGGP